MRDKRLDIQGLRALAVALVVVFHLWPERLTGGFVGVDVFFVISGYLITSHLMSEIERSGTVNVTEFWARRIRRLLPAALTVLAACLVLVFVVLPRSLLQQTLIEIGASSLYVLNWVLAANSVDYLAAGNNPSLVQHYWSLSVEEQFYFFWPLLLLAALALSSRLHGKQSAARNRRAVLLALVLVLVVSLITSIAETDRSPSSAFFVTTTRAWEFAAGGLIAFLPRSETAGLNGKVAAALGGWIGLGLVAYAAVFFNSASPFPGWLALVPVFGTALLIYFGDTRSSWSPSHLFSFGPAQLLGDISYSVYLWHWPLIIVAPYLLAAGLTFTAKLILIAVVVCLSLLTSKYVERPVIAAKGVLRSRRAAFVFAAASMVIVVAISGITFQRIEVARADVVAQLSVEADGTGCMGAAAMVVSNKCEAPYALTETVDPVFTTGDAYWTYGITSSIHHPDQPQACPEREDSLIRDCVFGSSVDPDLTIALVGDSHAEHIMDPLVAYADDKNWRIVLYALGGCTGFETEDIPSPEEAENVEDADREAIRNCRLWADEVRGELRASPDIDVVLFSNRSGRYTLPPEVATAVWDELIAGGKKVIAIGDVPGMKDGVAGPECVELSKATYDPCAWNPVAKEDFMHRASALSSVPLIDMKDYLCDAARCHTVIGGLIAYFDKSHLSLSYARTLSPLLGKDIEKVLEQDPSG